jgi:hypothetical protein
MAQVLEQAERNLADVFTGKGWLKETPSTVNTTQNYTVFGIA